MKKIYYGIFIILFTSCGIGRYKELAEIAFQESKLSKSSNSFIGLKTQSLGLFGFLPTEVPSAENPITDAKFKLGKMLYHDKRLSKDNTQSCNTCHDVANFGVDNQPFSKGNDGKLGGRNSPTTFNAALHLAQFWDGRAAHVEEQAGGPILNPIEMAMASKEAVINRLSGVQEYQTLFAEAFPNQAISYGNLQKAIGVYERKLLSPSRFDAFLKDDVQALTVNEKKGLQTFIQVGCVKCHSGTAIGGGTYEKFGVYTDYWTLTQSEKIDLGRFEVTKKEEDKYVFKVPSLRNVTKTFPYFHDGSVAKIQDAVRIMAQTQLDKKLTETEVKEIVTFLDALTGKVPAVLLP